MVQCSSSSRLRIEDISYFVLYMAVTFNFSKTKKVLSAIITTNTQLDVNLDFFFAIEQTNHKILHRNITSTNVTSLGL